MPRGRHRHSPPLHRLLPPSAVAGAAVVCAGGAWLLADPLLLRLLVAAAAATAVTGAVLMRNWDRAAGRRVAELTRARAGDQWRTEERIAELETDLEESRELRAKLDAKLRAKRVELAALRGEHAELLRRYATAETERASALEGRRQLALEAAAPARALPAASSTPTPAAYLQAARALENLTRNAAAQQARRATEQARRPDPAAPAGPAGEAGAEADEPRGKDTAAADRRHDRPSAAAPSVHGASAMRPVPPAAAVVPYTEPRRPAPRLQGGFDFFGTGKKAPAAIEAVQHEDLADVVGEEALAVRRREDRAVGKVIDLTAHDETEQLDVVELRRGAVS
ncbi:hypothetical protein E2C00_31735 [Streptomyces sp. WAC05374]|uniref:hypothetical protein n=1 Tax=Streptomyces sp. WAC05374 TaxID=2487420 RepID=UPI000F87B231|nr:hypothetical protein [Streptomyces sp. WAC05374]RST15256.1 hypothetical protein EF905_15260 [Streptomyces sp. WAC05374]TDF40040.1 hypothetical protein E2B92_26020 [Streptomyces sp. WAC05374]TDF47986.1 hypothetical protein E2C00_31735 [Streptomyces sp. WAC05374]TDF59670.1 hypothetical protein E2C02_02995 [Streptomyces sp. WAC05374]